MEILYEEEDNGYIGLSYNHTYNIWVLHISDIEIWSVSEFKRYKAIMERVKVDLRNRGITTLYGFCADKKAVKFNKMFGATTTGDFVKLANGDYELVVKLEI